MIMAALLVALLPGMVSCQSDIIDTNIDYADTSANLDVIDIETPI